MPYNTRRKSVSLASLGIQVPTSIKAQRPPPPSDVREQPSTKRLKRVHHEPAIVRPNLGPTPPPSPPDHQDLINYEDIGDEIVTSVVRVIEKSGNRPHTVRELAQTLSGTSGVSLIDNSANPHAIISSRLNTYLKRKNFSNEKPCVLDKKLITTHPKRTYFFLSTTEHMPIPEHFELPLPNRAVVSPAPTDEEDEDRRRRVLSPSPELEFFDHDEDNGDDMDMDESGSSVLSRDRTTSPSLRNSPPLEGDEQEFSDSAISLSIKHRSASRDLREGVPTLPLVIEEEPSMEHEHQTTFLGTYNLHTSAIPHPSPIVRPISPGNGPKSEGNTTSPHNPKALEIITSFRLNTTTDHTFESWGGDLKSPENVALHELDDLLGGL